MSNLQIKSRRNKNITILDLSGSLRIGETSAKFRTAFQLLISKGEKSIILNLANVSKIDSIGLGELVASYVSMKKNEGNVKLIHLTDKVNELMMITKLLTVFESFSKESRAIESFQNQ